MKMSQEDVWSKGVEREKPNDVEIKVLDLRVVVVLVFTSTTIEALVDNWRSTRATLHKSRGILLSSQVHI